MLTYNTLTATLWGLARTWRDITVTVPILQSAHGFTVGARLDDRHTLLRRHRIDALSATHADLEIWLHDMVSMFGTDLALHMRDGILTVAR